VSLEILRKIWWAFEWSCPDIWPCPAFHDVGQAPEASYTTASFCHACLCLSGPLRPRWDCLSLLSSRKVVVFTEKEKGLSLHGAALGKKGPGVACADLSLNLSFSNTHTHTHTDTHTQTYRDTHRHTHRHTHADIHTHRHIHTQTHTHTDTHTHRHTHTQSSFLFSIHMNLCNLERGPSSKRTVFFSYSPWIFALLFFWQTLSALKSGKKKKKKKNHFQIVEAQSISFWALSDHF